MKSNYRNTKQSNQPVAKRLTRTSVLLSAVMVSLSGGQADGGEAKEVTLSEQPAARDGSLLDDLWGLAVLYKDDSNPIIQQFKLRGRYHGQYYWVDADQGSADGWEDRRSRFGFDAKLFDKKVDVRVDFQSNDDFDDLYDGLVDAYIKWSPSKQFALTVGKSKPFIGEYDWLPSTNTQRTFERSQIFNQLQINRATGIKAEGSAPGFDWRAGVYSNDTPSSTGGSGSWGDGEFGSFDGGWSFSLGVSKDFKESLGADKATFWLDWIHSDRKAGDAVLGRYDDIVSATFWWVKDRTQVVVEGFYASGGDGQNSDAFGFYIEPSYEAIEDKLYLVGRYSFSTSDEDLGLRAQSRYETRAGGSRGDTYHSVYLGGQYHIYKDKLIILSGIEYAHLNDQGYDGISGLTGLRFSF